MGIPIIVGVTGHRDLRRQDVPLLRELVTGELKKFIERYPNSKFTLLDSIASGADSLCAEAALALDMELVCPLPMPVFEYRKDFSKVEAAAFDAFIQSASDVFVVPNSEPLPNRPTRDFYYRQAGIYVAQQSHFLLALWDGTPAKQDGCGTAEAVEFALRKINQNESDCPGAADCGAVLHVITSRRGAKDAPPACVRLIEREPGLLNETLRKIDALNSANRSC